MQNSDTTISSRNCGQSLAEAEIVFVQARSGALSAKVRTADGAETFIHSIYDPEREAAQNTAGMDCEDGDAFIVLGMGLGYHARELLSRFPSSRLLAMEMSPQLSDRAAELFPELFGTKSRLTLCGPDKLETALRDFAIRTRGRRLRHFHHPPCIRLHPEKYNHSVTRIHSVLTATAYDMLNSGRAGDARPLFQAACELAPEDWQGLFLLGRACMLSHNYKAAAESWEKAAALCPDTNTRANVRLELARLLERWKDREPRLVASAFRSAIDCAPESAAAAYARSALERIYISPVYERIVQTLPTIMQIEVTNVCNLRCVMCPREQMKRPKGFMDLELFKDLIARGRKNSMLRLIKLYFMGEPTLHKNLFEMIRFACTQGVPSVGIQTNGETLTPAYIDELLGCGLHDIGISFEKSTCDAYQKIRRGSDFEKVTRNISLLSERRKALGSKTMLMLSAVDMGESPEEKQAFISHWKGIVDHVSFLDYTAHENTSGPDAGEQARPKPGLCREPFEKMVVLWNGDVVPCCIDYDASHVVGNVKNTDLQSLWLGEKLVRLRETIINGRYREHKLCKTCPLSFANAAADTNADTEKSKGDETP